MKKAIIIGVLLVSAQAGLAALSATVDLTQQDAILTAHIILTQEQPTPGTITVDWQAPQGTSCANSSYPLTYQYKLYHTYATRTVVHNINGRLETCAGKWTVTVRDARKGELATASFDVRAFANTQPAATDSVTTKPANPLRPAPNANAAMQSNQVPAMNLTKPAPVASAPTNKTTNRTLNPTVPDNSTTNSAKPVNTLLPPANTDSGNKTNNSETTSSVNGNNSSH